MPTSSPTRDALVVGICNYEYLNDKPDGKTDLDTFKKLTALAEQARKLADLLDMQGGQGGFKVTRLPPPFTNPPSANLNGRVDLPDLEQAIKKLLSPPEESPTDTALLFFAGHGLIKEKEGFLATTEADGKNVYGFPLKTLRELLQKSSVKQLVIFLESCYSGELLTDFEETFKDDSHDICFITSARAHEEALADGLLTKELLELLDYTNVKEYPEKYGYVTDKLLLERLQAKVRLMEGWQRPQWKPEIQKRSIVLTNVAYTQEVPSDAVPYRGLDYFKTNTEDALFFNGRDQLIKELLNNVQEKRFLVVTGASGNGKSSVVRAGLLYQLPQKFPYRVLPVITPGQTPLASLQAVVDEARQTIDQTQRVVLTVDQFEEIFASACSDPERQAFFELLFNVAEDISGKFSVIIVIRSDFLGKFLESSPDSVKNNLILVKSPEDNEVRQMIVEPAKRAGFSVEPHLVAEMVADFRKLEVGLPFLEFALDTLWKQGKTGRLLKYEDYENSGKIAGILEREANGHYRSFSAEEQIVVQRIFLELTDLKGKSDTRRPVPYDHLLALPYPTARIEKVIHQLVEQRLITVDKPQDAPVVVNLAHETLIQHWSLFHDWLQEFREDATKQRRLEEDAQAHSDGKKSLLTDLDLGNAEAYLKVHQERVPLTEKAVQFIQASAAAVAEQKRQKKWQSRLKQALVSLVFIAAIVAVWFAYRASENEKVAIEQKIKVEKTLQAFDESIYELATQYDHNKGENLQEAMIEAFIDAVDKQITINPKHPLAWFNKAFFLQEQGKLEESVIAYRKQLEINPDRVGAWYNLGAILYQQSKLEESAIAFRKLLEVKPDHEKAWGSLGIILYEQQRYGESIDAFRKQLEINPNCDWASYNLGIALSIQGREEDAINAFRSQINHKPDQLWISITLGGYQPALTINLNFGSTEIPRKLLSAKLNFDPNYGDVWYNFGVALFKEGMLEETILAFRKLLETRHNNQQFSTNKQALLYGDQGEFLLKYNEHGNIVEIAFFDIDQKPLLLELEKNAVHRMILRYDDHTKIIETTYFGVNDLPINK